MTLNEAKDILKENMDGWLRSPLVTVDERLVEANDMAVKSLAAWEKVKDQLSQLVHHNLDVKENFEIGSTSRIECSTTASVLAGVIYLIDKHLSEVENDR